MQPNQLLGRSENQPRCVEEVRHKELPRKDTLQPVELPAYYEVWSRFPALEAVTHALVMQLSLYHFCSITFMVHHRWAWMVSVLCSAVGSLFGVSRHVCRFSPGKDLLYNSFYAVEVVLPTCVENHKGWHDKAELSCAKCLTTLVACVRDPLLLPSE